MASRTEGVQTITLPAYADYSDYQYSLVSIDSSGYAKLTGDGAQADGVLLNKPAAQGRAAEVAISGVVPVLLGGTATTGGLASSGSSGAANDAATGDDVVGVFVDGGSSGSIVSLLLKVQHATSVS